MKKIINTPEAVVYDMCGGILLANDKLTFNSKYKIISKKQKDRSKVTLISGGGSGHEPAHAGFIGKGLLDAAVCGDVFASPSQIQVYRAIKESASDKGTLLIIKNYSGDMMNFKNALHMAAEDGLTIDYVRVDDDIAVEDSLYTVGRRGVAGTIFVHKIAGAAAEAGMSLPETKRIAEKVIANVKSIGFALTSCTVPAKGSPTFDLGGAEMEYGIGIHGEPGIRREAVASARELAGRMTASISDELGLDPSSKVAVLINGFGATPLMELYVLNNEVIRELSGRDIAVARVFVGNYMTSLDMAGASISILKLDDEMESFMNAACESLALNISGACETVAYQDFFAEDKDGGDIAYSVETPASYAEIKTELTLNNIIYIVDVMSDCIIKNEQHFCELDSHAGDGDFGMSLAKGFRKLKAEWKSITGEAGMTISGFLNACSLIIIEHCGGASGPLWGSAFRAAAKSADGKESLTVGDVAELLSALIKGIQATEERSFGRGSVVGDKALIDALAPCADAWKDSANKNAGFKTAFKEGAGAAVEGAKKTESLAARVGRAGTVGDRSIGHPDAGAHALGVIFTEIEKAVQA